MAKTIIVVDDDRDTLSTIETLLKKNDYDVISALNAEDCLKKLKKKKPDLILIGDTASRTKILETATKMKGIKISYLITDESEKEDLRLYENVIGFINEPRNIKEFLRRVKESLK